MSALHAPSRCLPPPLLPETDSPGCAWGFRSSLLRFAPEAPAGGQGEGHPWRSPEGTAWGREALRGWGARSQPPCCGSGTGPGRAGEVPARAPARASGPWGRGREGAGASGSPSDGEMWPFTFTLQCQHLNHCLRARAQGCSEPAANKAAAWDPGRPAASPHPKNPRKDLAAPSAFLFPSLPFTSFFLLSLFSFFWGWGESQGPISGTRWPQGPRPNSQRASSLVSYPRMRS